MSSGTSEVLQPTSNFKETSASSGGSAPISRIAKQKDDWPWSPNLGKKAESFDLLTNPLNSALTPNDIESNNLTTKDKVTKLL